MSDGQVSKTTTTASVIKVTIVPRTRLVRVACPYCGDGHTHGWPHGAERIGSRVAGCGRGTYRVEVPRG